MSEKTSIFLKERVAVLRQALSFFAGNKSNIPSYTRKCIFMSQIDFWDFEMDSLIYCFDSFEQRQRQWSHIGSLHERMEKNNIIVNSKTIKKLYENTIYNPHKPITAPIEDLNSLIDFWNEIIINCEKLIDLNKIKSIDNCNGSSYLKNLDKFKKQHCRMN